MKLYAIRDKETGALADYVQAGKLSKDSWVLDKRFGVIWSNDGGLAFLAKDLSDTLNAKLELVTLRIEPSEPCWHCKGSSRQDPDNVWRDKFCRKCGRGLA